MPVDTLPFSEDILKKARELGGEITDFDRQVTPGQSLPFYTVVGRTSKDSSYRGEINGKSVEISRAGEFRRKDANGDVVYFTDLPEIVVLDARTSWVLFGQDNRIRARGISTSGLNGSVWTESDGSVIVGASCESSPFCRWVWQRQGGPEGKVLDGSGNIITKEDLATSSLQLWCWDLKNDEHCILQFSAGAIRHYRDWAREVEKQGVKVHSILWKVSSEPFDNGATAAPSYIPKLDAVRVLSQDEFFKAEEERAKLVVKAAALAPPKEQKALTGVLDNPPLVNVGPKVVDPKDVFANE